MALVHKIVWFVCLFCINLILSMQYQLRSFCSFITFYTSLLLFGNFQDDTIAEIPYFEELPLHVAILVFEDDISRKDVSNLLIWSCRLGIGHVSILDKKGFVKSNRKELCAEANRRKHSILKKHSCGVNLIFSNGKVPYVYNTITKNGHKTENLHIYLLSSEDGKQQIIQAAKALCKDAKNKPDILENFHAPHFEKYMKGVFNVPDPELVIVFGKVSGLMGYLPWQVRLSEIITQPTHHNFSLKEFHNILLRYNKCEQRCGK